MVSHFMNVIKGDISRFMNEMEALQSHFMNEPCPSDTKSVASAYPPINFWTGRRISVSLVYMSMSIMNGR